MFAREGEPTINGAILYREFAREHLNASQEWVVALGVRLTRPIQASMDTFEERLMAWDQDKEKYKRMTQQGLGDLSYIYLQDMMPDEVKARFELDKHNIETIGKLRSFFTHMISDNKSAKKKKSKGLHELLKEAGSSEGSPDGEGGNLLYSLLSHAKPSGGQFGCRCSDLWPADVCRNT